MCTINALCLERLDEFLELMLQLKIKYGHDKTFFYLNILRFPTFQGPLVLPNYLIKKYNNKLKKWFEKNKNNLYSRSEKNSLLNLIVIVWKI